MGKAARQKSSNRQGTSIEDVTKKSRIVRLIGGTANIAQIIGTIITICAFYYAYSQYNLYLHEISRKPDVILHIFYAEIPETSKSEKVPLLRGFEFSDSSEFSRPMKLVISIGNKGDIVAKEILSFLSFNNNLRILQIDSQRSKMLLPVPEAQIFQYFSENMSLPPYFGPIPILFLTASLRKFEGKKILIGGYSIQCGGQKHKNYNLIYDSEKKDFISELSSIQPEGEPGMIIPFPGGGAAPLHLEK